jgi:hypothetical protein
MALLFHLTGMLRFICFEFFFAKPRKRQTYVASDRSIHFSHFIRQVRVSDIPELCNSKIEIKYLPFTSFISITIKNVSHNEPVS